MNTNEKITHIRQVTMSSFGKIAAALKQTNDDADAAIALLIKQRDADAGDIANRKADNNFVYSYVHNNKIGAMIILASQTDFVSKNELFIQLAKDVCMHIVSSPVQAEYVTQDHIPEEIIMEWRKSYLIGIENKPLAIIDKIVGGKVEKKMTEVSLSNQKFIKDESITIGELINKVSATVKEKIEIKKFVRFSA